MAYLDVSDLSYSYDNGFALTGITLSLESGEMVGLLGPNGSGKTTLLKLLSGILKPRTGDIRLKNISLAKLSRNTVARSVAVVPQQFAIPFSFTVREVISLGRTPYRSFLGWESAGDREVTSRAMALTGVTSLEERRFEDLSGGERQKVALATALAQEPEFLLLDEPTVHLDIAHQIEILKRVKSLSAGKGLTVLAAGHDLNLAALFFSRLILLKEGKVVASGTPDAVLTETLIKEVFDTEVRVAADPETGVPHIHLIPDTPKKPAI